MGNEDMENVESNLSSVEIKKYLNVNYCKLKLFKRSLQVFRSSYYGYESLRDNSSYVRKFNEFVNLMTKVFQSDELAQVDLNELLEAIDKELDKSGLMVHIGIADYKVVGSLDFPALVVRNSIGECMQIPINMETYSGRMNVISFKLKFSQLKELRTKNKALQIELTSSDDTGKAQALPNKLILHYLSIHPEGYRTWFEFGPNVKALVTIRFSIKSTYSGSRLTLQEHTQLIYHLFKYRFSEYLKRNTDDVMLQTHRNSQKRTTGMHFEVNPSSSEAFWPTRIQSASMEKESNQTGGSTPATVPRSIHCHELELAWDESDDPIEEEFCRCTEWCNVSSFYYHNPVFRFLMVQFTNFYVQSNASLPSSYMCALSYLLSEFSDNQIPISILYILNSILSYMKLSYSKKIQFLAIDVCSYRFLRQMDINKLMKVMHNREPFNPSLVTCITTFYQIFMYLHTHIGKIHAIVPNKYIDAWYDQLYEVIYKGYNSYLLTSTKEAFHGIRDYSPIALFERFSYSTKWASYEFDIEEVLHSRDILFNESQNPLFAKFNCHPTLQIIYNASKFIIEIYQTLADSEKKSQKCFFAIKYDKLLCSEMSQLDKFENGLFAILLTGDYVGPNSAVPRFAKKIYILFTLRLYSFAFCIQQYMADSILRYNQTASSGYVMNLPDNLNFAFNCEWIERTYSRAFCMENIFKDRCPELQQSIDNFYRVVWPSTELNLSDANELASGILQEYCKVCLWWEIDGNNLCIFRQLVTLPCKMMEECVARADNLYMHEFGFMDTLKVDAQLKCFIKDDAVVHLLEAACFTLVRTVSTLIKSIHGTQVANSTKSNKRSVNLTLARPGIIELMSTLDAARASLSQLEALFFIFNDQSESIARSIESTERTITGMYRDLYVKLASEWICQVKHFIEEFSPKKFVIILRFTLITGVHFIVRFHRYFRRDYINFKNELQTLEGKLKELKGFNYNKYKAQIEEMFKYEINCIGSKPFICDSLKAKIYEATLPGAKAKNKNAYETLKQFQIDIDKLV